MSVDEPFEVVDEGEDKTKEPFLEIPREKRTVKLVKRSSRGHRPDESDNDDGINWGMIVIVTGFGGFLWGFGPPSFALLYTILVIVAGIIVRGTD